MEELEDIIDLNNNMAVWDAEFLTALAAVNGQVLDSLNGLIDRLSFNGKATTPAEMRANMREVTMWRANIIDLVNQSGMRDAVRVLVNRMGQGTARLNTYFEKIDASFSPEPYRMLLENLTTQTVSLLTGSVVDSVYGRQLGDVLDWHVLTKSTGAEVRSVLREKLTEGSILSKDLHRVASDALYTYSRGYTMAVAEGLGLKHFFFMGTAITTTRKFCNERIGKAFSQKEVEAWADLTWSGKNEATTKTTIFWYCGGYNCRHRLLPISKSMFNQFQNQN
ncbi:hypothetical protein [Larkinella sp. C7]|uniref:hypothetical protein n=1 Tax=Larkinella sp. C7 TaxID=2576607 RepID=UPI001111089B|nr:hypothetical protein [Larkinella sp. C7]